MRLPNAAHASRPWRIHEVAPDFELEDVWALPTPGGPDDFARLVKQFSARREASDSHMMLWDHGMPIPQLDAAGKQVMDADGRPVFVSPREQRLEADVNIEFQSTAKQADAAAKLAWFFRAANDKYATDYPAAVGPHMTNTDSTPFMDLIPAISLRENERGMHVGAGWDPNWHQPSDVFSTYSDKDFRLGLNAAQTTLAAIAQLTGATIKK